MAELYGIWGDQQIPYHDPRAFSVAVQIFSDAKLHSLIYNGDWGDYMDLGTYPKGSRTELYESLKREVQIQAEKLREAHKSIKPKIAKWNDGNHEWRLWRALTKNPHLAAKVLDLEFPETMLHSIRDAVSIQTMMGLDKLGIKYSGDYPEGCWLKDGIEDAHNVYVQHGYTARKKSGYTVSGQMDDHWSSQVIGHCERLAGPIWTRKLGRDYFGIESGNLSLIGEPELGKGIYAGVPHSVPKLMNHRQGISLIAYDAGEFWPFTIRIRDGKAWWNGKLYKA